MALQRRAWFRHLRQIWKDEQAIDAYGLAQAYENANNRLLYGGFWSWMRNIVSEWLTGFRNRKAQIALTTMTQYTHDLEELLAREYAHNDELLNNAEQAKQMRAKYDHLRRQQNSKPAQEQS